MAAAGVIAGRQRWSAEQAEAAAWLDSLPEQSVDLVFGSPPYCDARTYGIDAVYDCVSWVEWMLKVTASAQRACRGPVLWVAAGVTRDRNYWPACEGLMWEWWKRGGDCQLYRPCAWVKTDEDDGGTGIPGSGGDDYLRADWEYVMCFKRPGKLFWSDNTVMGHEPVCAQVGGEMSNRLQDGQRSNDDPWGKHGRGNNIGGRKKNGEKLRGTTAGPKKVGTSRRANGTRKNTEPGAPEGGYPMPKLANPGNVVRARVGGGHMGSRLCHEGEAPFPEKLAEFFVRTFCPEDGIVCDPFSGSGTTAAVAFRWGRRGVYCDLRDSQVELTKKRVAECVTMFDPPAAAEPEPATGEASGCLFDHVDAPAAGRE
jgi:hypothetical protein